MASGTPALVAVHGENEDRPLRPRSGEDPEVGKSREQLLADDDKDEAPSLRVILVPHRALPDLQRMKLLPEELIHPSSK